MANIKQEDNNIHIAIDQSVDENEDHQYSLTVDSKGNYHLQQKTVPVTYRVIQVRKNDDNILSTVLDNQQNDLNVSLQEISEAQALLDEDSEAAEDSNVAYFSASSLLDNNNITNGCSATSPVYVVVPQQLQNQSKIRLSSTRISRDERRKATHNEVEKRRRDKINSWFTQLAQLIPDLQIDSTRTSDSKGDVLAKACEYIVDLQNQNRLLTDSLQQMEELRNSYALIHHELEDVRKQNEMLRLQLVNNGTDIIECMNT